MKRVVIVGRPNVGKSALLNRLAGRSVAIVHDQPGVTRDRIRATVERNSRSYEFIDTGGIGLFETAATPRVIARAVENQVQAAIAAADIILMVVDGLEGLRPLDEEIASMLRKGGKPTWLVVNKLDLARHEDGATEFAQLGMQPVFHISAAHGRGIESLWDALEARNTATEADLLPQKVGRFTPIAAHAANPLPRIAVVGRPNVGKSSLINRLVGDERLIVSEVPGTTRDSIDLEVELHGRPYVLTDTAGIRQKRKIRSSVEMYSRHWTERSIQGCDIALLMLDAVDGPTRQDREIAGLILQYHKPCIILVNKWDLNETREPSRGKTSARRIVSRSEYEKCLRGSLPFLDYAPVLFISALQGYHASIIWKLIEEINAARRTRFTTGALNRTFTRAQDRLPPPMRHGLRLKIYYATQKVGMATPTFVLFINQARFWVNSYERYLMNQLRRENPLTGCPIVFELREHQARIERQRTEPVNKGTARSTERRRGYGGRRRARRSSG
jgi:GTP-binding protein